MSASLICSQATRRHSKATFAECFSLTSRVRIQPVCAWHCSAGQQSRARAHARAGHRGQRAHGSALRHGGRDVAVLAPCPPRCAGSLFGSCPARRRQSDHSHAPPSPRNPACRPPPCPFLRPPNPPGLTLRSQDLRGWRMAHWPMVTPHTLQPLFSHLRLGGHSDNCLWQADPWKCLGDSGCVHSADCPDLQQSQHVSQINFLKTFSGTDAPTRQSLMLGHRFCHRAWESVSNKLQHEVPGNASVRESLHTGTQTPIHPIWEFHRWPLSSRWDVDG